MTLTTRYGAASNVANAAASSFGGIRRSRRCGSEGPNILCEEKFKIMILTLVTLSASFLPHGMFQLSCPDISAAVSSGVDSD